MIKFRKNLTVINLYVPVLLEQGLATISTMLGTIIVSNISPTAVSGVGMVDIMNFIFMNMLVAIGTGVTAIVSQCVGRENPKEAAKSAAQSLSLAIYSSAIFGILLLVSRKWLLLFLFGKAEADVISSAYDYLFFTSISLPFLAVFNVMSGIRRGTGDNLTPLAGSFVANIVYVIVALFCIYFLHMGVQSVGFGLLFSRIASTAVLTFFLIKYPRMIKIKSLPLKIERKVLKPVLNIAIPGAMDSLVFNGGKLIVQVFMSGMGTASLAAYPICNSLSNFLQLPGRTYQITAVTLTGRAFGEGNFKKAKKIMLCQTLYTTISQTLMSVIFVIMFTPLIHLFTHDVEIIRISKVLMYIMFIFTPLFWGSSFVTPNGLRATGDAKFTMIISMISMIFCRVIGSWFLGIYLNMGITGIWISMIVDWIIRSLFYIPRVLSGKWHKKSAEIKQ